MRECFSGRNLSKGLKLAFVPAAHPSAYMSLSIPSLSKSFFAAMPLTPAPNTATLLPLDIAAIFFFMSSESFIGYLIFNVAKPARANISDIIQKRTTTFVSGQPFSSK